MKSFLSTRARVNTPTTAPVPEAPVGFEPVRDREPDRADHHESVSIECVREGDRVVRLKIRCACGDLIEIDCLYEAGGA